MFFTYIMLFLFLCFFCCFFFFFFNDTATTEIYTLSLHDALPISRSGSGGSSARRSSREQTCDRDHASRRRGHPVIVGCGEALVDFTVERSERGPLYRPHVGGASLNVAVALARLGVAAGFLGGLSRDAFGRFLRAQLLASGVDPRYVCERAEPTALAFVQQEDGREPAFSFYGQGTAERALRPDDLPTAFPPDAEALHFAGYSLLVEPVGTTLETLGRREQGRRLIFLDPNVRPAL